MQAAGLNCRPLRRELDKERVALLAETSREPSGARRVCRRYRRQAREQELLSFLSSWGDRRAGLWIDEATGLFVGEAAEAYLSAASSGENGAVTMRSEKPLLAILATS